MPRSMREAFDLIVRNPEYNKTLFAVPNSAVPVQDYAAALHASSVIEDGGTLQIGIGALGDAVAHACILRHNNNDGLPGDAREADAPAHAVAGPRSFEQGLYVSTEMFVNGMMHLIEQGVVKRKVYDHLALQRGLTRRNRATGRRALVRLCQDARG